MKVRFDQYSRSEPPALVVEAETDADRLALMAVMRGQWKFSSATVQPFDCGISCESNLGPMRLTFAVGAELPAGG